LLSVLWLRLRVLWLLLRVLGRRTAWRRLERLALLHRELIVLGRLLDSFQTCLVALVRFEVDRLLVELSRGGELVGRLTRQGQIIEGDMVLGLGFADRRKAFPGRRPFACLGVSNSGAVVAVHQRGHAAAQFYLDRLLARGERVELPSGRYFHSVVALPKLGDGKSRLHILFPEADYDRAWQREVFPPIVFVALALPVVLMLSHWTASRIAGRVGRLHSHVDRIAGGEFDQFPLPDGDDEIRSLAAAVNRMSSMLASYEQEVRHTERMRTLAHLGGGIAHQLRNSATGLAMAVDLHADECPLAGASESLGVAKRQLRLMEQYIQRFLQLGKPGETASVAPNHPS